jgi:hypothetical protein
MAIQVSVAIKAMPKKCLKAPARSSGIHRAGAKSMRHKTGKRNFEGRLRYLTTASLKILSDLRLQRARNINSNTLITRPTATMLIITTNKWASGLTSLSPLRRSRTYISLSLKFIFAYKKFLQNALSKRFLSLLKGQKGENSPFFVISSEIRKLKFH